MVGFKGRHYDDDNSSDEDGWIFDPELSELNRSFERELREEAAENEYITAEQEQRERTLFDVALEIRNRADIISLQVCQYIFKGQISNAGRDYLSVACEEFDLEVPFWSVSSVTTVKKTKQGGTAPQQVAGSFVMRLAELAENRANFEMGFASSEKLAKGRIIAIGQDHCVLHDGTYETIVPLGAIAFALVKVGSSWR